VDGSKDVLVAVDGHGVEGAKFWMSVLTDLRNRGPWRDVFFLVFDGLKGLPDVVGTSGHTVVQSALFISFAYVSVGFPCQTMMRSSGISKRSTPHRPRTRPSSRWRSSRKKWWEEVSGDHPAGGVRLERVHPVLGLRRRNPPVICSTTPSKASTPATGEQYGHAGISPPSRLR